MSAPSLERRLADVENDIAALKKSLAENGSHKDWRRTVGMFEGDEIMMQIDELTLQIRENDRKKKPSGRPRRKAVKS